MMFFIGLTEFICLIGFVLAIIMMIVQAVRKKQAWQWAVCLGVCIILIAVCIALTPEKPNDEIQVMETQTEAVTEAPKTEPVTEAPKTETVTEVPKTEPATEEPKTEAVTEAPKTEPATETPETTAETPKETDPAQRIQKLAEDSFKFDYQNLKSEKGINMVMLSVTPTALYADESGWIRDNLNRYINFCRLAYDSDEAEPVRFRIYAEGMDHYGNSTEFLGMDVLMMPDVFRKYQWDNLQYMMISEEMAEDFKILQVHDVFLRGMDPEKVIYFGAEENGDIW